MIKTAIKKLLYFIPPIRRYVDQVRQTKKLATSQEEEIASLQEKLATTSNPVLSKSSSDLKTDRLLAHPLNIPLPEI